MDEQSLNKANGESAIVNFATVFEKEDWSTGSVEITSTLLNISEFQEEKTPEAEKRFRHALKHSNMLKNDFGEKYNGNHK